MAEMNYTYRDATHTINSYDEIVSAYNWIRDALRAVFQDREGLYIRCTVVFSSDEMSYECDSIDEFKKYAFGKTITPKRMMVYVSKDWVGSLIDVFASYKKDAEMQEFVLTSKDELLIINLREALRTNKKGDPQIKETVVMKIEDNSVHIGSNNRISNSVIGSKNDIENEQETVPSESKDEKWYSKSFWQVVIPLTVTIIGAAICAWLGLN